MILSELSESEEKMRQDILHLGYRIRWLPMVEIPTNDIERKMSMDLSMDHMGVYELVELAEAHDILTRRHKVINGLMEKHHRHDP